METCIHVAIRHASMLPNPHADVNQDLDQDLYLDQDPGIVVPVAIISAHTAIPYYYSTGTKHLTVYVATTIAFK